MTEELDPSSGDDIQITSSDADFSVSVYDDDIQVRVDASISVNGVGIQAGGLLGEVLTKKSSIDYDTEWKAPFTPVPGDGTASQVLTKLSATPYDVAWLDVPPGVPAGGTTGQVLSKVTTLDYDLTWVTPVDAVAKTGDTMTGFLTLITDPVNSLHAATKQYVDLKAPIASPEFTGIPLAPLPAGGAPSNQIATVGFVQSAAGAYLPLAGGALTGALSLVGDPVSALHAAPKQYVDTKAPIASPALTGAPTAPTAAPGTNTTQIATTAFVEAKVGLFLPLAGGTMTGQLNMGGFRIIDLAVPVLGTGAARKAEVDLKAPLASPTFTGVPAAPTAAPGTNTTQIATTAFVSAAASLFLPLAGGALAGFLTLHADPTALMHAATKQYVDTKAPISSPVFTGTPTAPTAVEGTNTDQIATTAFVNAAVTGTGLFLPLTGGTLTGALHVSAGALTVSGGAISLSRTGDVADADMLFDVDAGRTALFRLRTAGTNRWIFGKDAIAETGADAGSNFFLRAYDDAGTAPLDVISIARATQVVAFSQIPTAPTATAGDNSAQLATTAFVQAKANFYLPLTGGTLSSFLTLHADPTALLHAVTKQYVDNKAALYLPLAGGTLSNFLTLHADPTSAMHAATRQYVTAQVGLYLPLTGGTLTNFLTLNADPTSALHAVTKQYVDAKDALYLLLTGGTLSNFLTLHADPSTAFHAATKQYVDAQNALYLPLVGGTLTGALNVTTGAITAFGGHITVDRSGDATAAYIRAQSDTGLGAYVSFHTGSVGRFVLGKTNDTETGVSNAGSNFSLYSYDDAGALIGEVFKVTRATRVMNFIVSPTAPTPTAGDNSTQLATTAFVQTKAAGYLLLTGGSVSGTLNVTAGSLVASGGPISCSRTGDAADGDIFIDVDAGRTGYLRFRTGTSQRWQFGKTAVAESGSNAGSNFVVNAYSDTNTLIGAALTIARASRIVDFPVSPTVPTVTSGDSSTKVASTAFVAAAVAAATTGGVPAGGAVNQVLAKVSATDYDMTWVDPAGVGTFLALTGGTMTGALTLSAVAPTADHAIKKSYVDAAVTGLAPLTSPAFTGTPTAPTPSDVDNSTRIATTAFVHDVVGDAQAVNTATYLPLAGGVMAGVLNMNNNIIANVPDPSQAHHPINRSWFDAGLALKANLAGAVFTGQVTVLAPTSAMHPATRQYVDDGLSPKANLAGAVFTGQVTVLAPTSAMHPATRQYVDDGLSPKANLAGATFTGPVIVPTPTTDFHATTKDYVDDADALKSNLASPTFTGIPTAPLPSGTPTNQIATVAYVTSIAGAYLPLAGGTITGSVNVTTGSLTASGGSISINRAGDVADADLFMDVDAGRTAYLRFRTGTSHRWRVGKDSSSESGSDAGSNFILQAYNDAGVANTVLTVARATRILNFLLSPTAPTPSPGDSTTKLATTAFVAAAVGGAGLYLPITGGTLTGFLTLHADPINAMDAATRGYVDAELTLKSNLASPAFSGNPTAPTQLGTDNSTRLATTQYVTSKFATLPATYVPFGGGTLTGFLTLHADPTSAMHAATRAYVDLRAPLLSPAFTGTPTAPQPSDADSSTRIATTGFVHDVVSGEAVAKIGSTMTGLLILSGDPAVALGAATRQYVDLKANINSPAFTGTPTAPQPADTDSSLRIATTGFTHDVVDDAIVGVVLKAGSTMTGMLTLPATVPSTGNHATNKTYVDAQRDTRLALAGGTMTGAINMNSQFLTNVPTPTAGDHAANKTYADLMLRKSGGTMTGDIDMGGNDIIVDDVIANALHMAGGIDMNTNSISGINTLTFTSGGAGKITGLKAPEAFTEPMRGQDVIAQRDVGNYHFSEKWVSGGGQPIIGFTGGITVAGGEFGPWAMRINNVSVTEEEFHPVDVESFYECSARVKAALTTIRVRIGVQCFSASKVALGYRWIIGSYPTTGGEDDGWLGFPASFVNVGGVIRGESDADPANRIWNFPPGTRYIKRIAQAFDAAGDVDIDYFIFRKLGVGEVITGEMFGMRANGPTTALNTHGEWNSYALERLVQYLILLGGVGQLGVGTYDIGVTLDWASNNNNPPFTLQGHGDATVLRRSTKTAPGNQLYYFHDVSNATLKNFKIDGNNLGPSNAWEYGPYPENYGSSSVAGTSRGTQSGFDYSHTLAFGFEIPGGGHDVTIDGLTIIYGSKGTMLYIAGDDTAVPTIRTRNIIVQNCYLDGKNSSANGILIGSSDESHIRDCTVIGVRSTKFPAYYQLDPTVSATVMQLYEFASPAMGIQFKHDCTRCSIDNVIAVSCRNHVVFTGTTEPSNNCSATGVVIRMGSGGNFGFSIDDMVGGVFTGIDVDGTNQQPDFDAPAAMGINVGGNSSDNYIQAVVRRIWPGSAANEDSGSFYGRALRFTSTSHGNIAELSIISDCGNRPLLWRSTCHDNLAIVGLNTNTGITRTAITNNFGLDVSTYSGANNNFMRYLRDIAFDLRTPDAV